VNEKYFSEYHTSFYANSCDITHPHITTCISDIFTHLTSTLPTVFIRISCRNFRNRTLIFYSKSSKISSFFYKPPPVSRGDEKKSQSVMSSQSFLLAILLCLADHAISLKMYCPPTAVVALQTEVIPNLA
jgi:hypothetical protein